MVMKSVVLILLLVVLAVCIFFLAKTLKKDQAQGSTQKPDTEQSQDGADATDDTETGDDASSDAQDTAAPATDAKTTAMEQAEYLAATYDYDGAIETLNGVEVQLMTPRSRQRSLSIRQRRTAVFRLTWMR